MTGRVFMRGMAGALAAFALVSACYVGGLIAHYGVDPDGSPLNIFGHSMMFMPMIFGGMAAWLWAATEARP